MFFVTDELKHASFLHTISSGLDFIERFFHLLGRNICQKAQTACINSQNRNSFSPYAAGSFQECSVASDTDYHISVKIISVKQVIGMNVHFELCSQELIKVPAHTDFCFLPSQ